MRRDDLISPGYSIVLAKLYKLHLNATLAESLLSSARATLSQAVERVPVDFSSLRTTFADSLASLQESQNPAAKAIGRFTSDPRLHELSSKALALADTYSPHLVGLVAVLFAVFLSSRSQRRDQSLYEEQLRQFDARMNDYGLGTSGANANGTMPAGGDRKDRAADDHGEVEVQWGREKLRIPLPQPSAPLSQFRTTLSNMTGVPPSHQKLIYAGAVLKDDNLPMSAYGLVEEDPSAVNASEPQKGRSFWDSWSLMGRKSTANKKGLKKLVMLGSATVSGHVNDHLSSRKDLQDLAAASPSGSVATAPGGADASASVAEAKVDSEETVQSRIRQIAVHKLDELEPQVKQVEAWLAQEQARRAAAGPDAQNDADAPPPPKRMLLYLSENLLQGLLKLDSTEIPSGYTEARKERKEAVRRVQEVLDRVDAAKEGWKKLGLSLT